MFVDLSMSSIQLVDETISELVETLLLCVNNSLCCDRSERNFVCDIVVHMRLLLSSENTIQLWTRAV